MSKLGPRACAICGPTITPCYWCGAKLGHRHLVVISRQGHTLGRVAACDAHSPPDGLLVTDPHGAIPAPGAPGSAVVGTTPEKRARDRAYRYATSVIRERHRREFDAVYADVLGAADEGKAA